MSFFINFCSRKLSFLFLFLIIIFSVNATTYTVGNGKDYSTPNDLYLANVLEDGDVIEIDAGEYINKASLAFWNKNNLTIRGVGGVAHMKVTAQEYNIQGKSIWVISGANVTVENIEFSGCKVPDKNGAGIRVESSNLTIVNCYFHHNENGILVYNNAESNLTVESSEFAYNGRSNDGYAHNIYVGRINKFVFKYNYSHHCTVGHNLKSRAKENIISYNRIMDEDTGSSSRLIDLPDGGFSIIKGNVLMQGPNAPNGNLIGYCVENSYHDVKKIYLVNNTLVNKRKNYALFLDLRDGEALIQNNIFAGFGTLSSGKAAKTLKTNLIESNIDKVNFTDETNFDYQLKLNSVAIDYGSELNSINGYSLVPTKSYKHPLSYISRNISGKIDVGAYEFLTDSGSGNGTGNSGGGENGNGNGNGSENSENKATFYPNPAKDYLIINGNLSVDKVQVSDLSGKILTNITPIANKISIKKLKAGVFIFSFYHNNGYIKSQKIVIHK